MRCYMMGCDDVLQPWAHPGAFTILYGEVFKAAFECNSDLYVHKWKTCGKTPKYGKSVMLLYFNPLKDKLSI